MAITKSSFGQLSTGEAVHLFTLSNTNGMSVKIIDYGGIIKEIHAPDRAGNFADVALGKDTLKDYLDGHPHFGCITGRVAGRIKDGRFSINGVEHVLVQNNASNCLHGGEDGFDKQVWDASIIESDGSEKLQLHYIDPNGHNNFPGTVDCTVTYALTEDNGLEISYRATTDKSTPLNLTNHSYFNLAGHDSGTVLGHEVQILSDTVASVDEVATLIGRKDPVIRGFNDYREPVILSELETLEVNNADIHFNHPKGRTETPKRVATIHEPNTGRTLDVYTTEPGVQFYAGLSLSDQAPETGKEGCIYPAMGGLCLETQDYADTVNFPSMGGAILYPGETFQSTTVYQFGTRG
jgi:aldose 1-epimerase